MQDHISRFREIIEKASFSETLDIDSILLVLDESIEKEELIFNLVNLFTQRTKANFTFLLAVRGYLAQAKEANIPLQTLSQLITKIKTKFQQEEELFGVSFITDEEIAPIERIRELLRKRKMELIIIPAPFTQFVTEEQRSETSLGITIDQLIHETLFQHKIPLLLVRTNKKFALPFSKVRLLFREPSINNDILGWLLTFTKEDSTIEITHAISEENEIERITLYYQVIQEWIEKENKQLKVNFSDTKHKLKDFCDQSIFDYDSLLIFQGLTDSDDTLQIIEALCFQECNVLILPSQTE
ncbi:MAG: hypothetical protein ACFFCQ_17870 [Promethearchaeota archaeon]